MKALIINSQGNPDEAFVLAKLALKNSMKSHVCWHVYGLLYRSAKNFEEAIKAYKFALKLEPESQQIQKDLALLQIQMRDYQGYVQSRRAILQQRTGWRPNWTALAVAQHLAGDLANAERTLTTYEETLKSPPPRTDTEHAEAILYKNSIIAEMGEIERALEHLDAAAKNNPDRTSVMELRAQYLLSLGRKEEAAKAYRLLLKRNAENRAYFEGLQEALGLDKSDVEGLKAFYGDVAKDNPRGDAATRIPLGLLEGDEFRQAADQYLQRMLHKGVWSTFNNVKALYSDIEKRVTIQDLVEGFAAGKANIQANGSTERQTNGDSDLFTPSVRYFLAQHYTYHSSRDLPKAMKYIDEALTSAPESVEYHMTKARIWKHYGNVQKAAELMEKGRTLDIRDRYINTKAAKYQLRNDENEAAIRNMGKFTRNEALGGPLGDLHDMQCVWYITEDGESYIRQGNLGLALKRFTSISSIFDIWQEDQFDFHSFSLRKGQIRAYIDMMRWEDQLREHPFFTRAAISAARIYVMLHDQPNLAHPQMTNGVNGEKMDHAERKKAQKKARKDQEKQAKEEAERKDARKPAAVDQNGDPKKEDKDPKGEKLLQTSEPLVEAMKFITPLLEFSPKNIQAQQMAFEVFIRRSKCPTLQDQYCKLDRRTNPFTEKYLLALRALLASHALSPSDPTTHEQAIRLGHTFRTQTEAPDRKIQEVLAAEFDPVLPASTDLSKHNDEFLQKHHESAPHVQACLRAKQLLDPSSSEKNQQDVIRTLALEGTSLADAVRGSELLKEWKAKDQYRDDYLAAAHDRWPEASAFQKKSN